MCGFSGFIGETEGDGETRKAVLKKMMDKIAHRGPDSEGMFVDDKAALGFRKHNRP